MLAGSLLPDKQGLTVAKATKNHFSRLRPDTRTADNGSENARHKETGVSACFCNPESPWQKPHVEGSIGLLRRRFLPKGANFAEISDETFQSQLHLLNHKYRKSLKCKSVYEVSLECDIIKRAPRIGLSKAIAFR